MKGELMIETEHEYKPNFIDIGPLGYGNAESAISYDKKIENGEVPKPLADRVAELLKSGELLVDVDELDDGCIDGRPTESVLYVTEEGEFYSKDADNSNHERAKVAGGGYITGTAMRLGAGYKGNSINEDILATGAEFTENDVYCGAHTGKHQHEDNTDCGANKKMREIFNAALEYEEEIAGSTKALVELAGLKFNPDTFSAVVNNWQLVLNDSQYFAGSSDVDRLNAVKAVIETAHQTKNADKPLSVVKHLAHDHNEIGLAVNFVPGKTVSQVALAEKLRGENPDTDPKDLPQIFVVDAWRIVELANAGVKDEDKEAAIYAGVMYQLATAAVLTDGTLPASAYALAA
ncbi:MAG: hypothetical protein WAQ27_04490 [Candidatus Microsaccharimonas sp.]